MGVEKMSVSFELELGEAIRTSATAAGQSVSAWLADAARDRLRLEALEDAVCTRWVDLCLDLSGRLGGRRRDA